MSANLVSAVRQIAAERGIDDTEILEGIKQAIRLAFKRDYPEDEGASLEVEIDAEEDSIAVYADKKVVEEVTSAATQISLSDAQKIQPKLKVGDHVLVEITHTGDFGRVAAQAARQVILQKIKEAETDAVVSQFQAKIGTVDTAIVQRMDRDGSVICEIYRGVARMPKEEQIASEFYQSGSRIKVYLKKVLEDAKGKTLIVSRSEPNFLRALFEMEVPEIASGTVEIMAIAREAGARSKVAVRSNAEGVDPIGSCVGQRGSRINSITNELKTTRGEEKIDIIPWDEDIKKFIANSIRPAEAIEVRLINEEEKHALILVDDEYLSLAIGREGQNVRLAVKLTGWRLDIQGKQGFSENGETSKFEEEAGIAPKSAAKNAAKPAKTDKSEAKATTEKEAPTSELAELGLTSRVLSSLSKLGITTKQELQAKIEAGEKLAGIGGKSLDDIKAALAK